MQSEVKCGFKDEQTNNCLYGAIFNLIRECDASKCPKAAQLAANEGR